MLTVKSELFLDVHFYAFQRILTNPVHKFLPGFFEASISILVQAGPKDADLILVLFNGGNQVGLHLALPLWRLLFELIDEIRKNYCQGDQVPVFVYIASLEYYHFIQQLRKVLQQILIKTYLKSLLDEDKEFEQTICIMKQNRVLQCQEAAAPNHG